MHKFFICRHCGNMVGLINDKGVPLKCCGESMRELIPNTVEASAEKHLPTVTVEGNLINVNVGSIDHPQTPEHHIAFIYLETKKGGQRKALRAGEEPSAVFALADDTPLAVYAYCNLHGLWKTGI